MSSNSEPSSRDLTRKTLGAFRWTYASIILQGILQLVVLSILARLLSPREFGIVAMALLFINFVERVGFLGLGPTLVQRDSLSARHLRAGSALSLLLGLAAGGLLFISAGLISEFFGEPSLVHVIQVLSVIFLLESLGTVPESLLQRDLAFKPLLVATNTAYALGNGVTGITLACMGYGVWSLVIAAIVTRFVKLAILIYLRPTPLAVIPPRLEAFELLRTGLGFTLGRLLSYLALTGDNFVIGRILGSTALGAYGRAYQLMALPATYFGQVLEKVLFPAMARRQGNPEQLGRVFLWGIECSALLGLSATVLMYCTAPEIIYVLFGEKWRSVVPTLQILSLGMFFRLCYKNSDTLIRSLGAVYRHAYLQLAYSMIVVIGSVIGSRWGLEGVAFAVLIAVISNYLLLSRFGLRLLNLSWDAFFRAHSCAIWTAVCLGIVIFPTTTFLRSAQVHPVGVLAASGVAAGLTFMAALRWMPSAIRPTVFTWAVENFRFERMGAIGRFAVALLSPSGVQRAPA